MIEISITDKNIELYRPLLNRSFRILINGYIYGAGTFLRYMYLEFGSVRTNKLLHRVFNSNGDKLSIRYRDTLKLDFYVK